MRIEHGHDKYDEPQVFTLKDAAFFFLLGLLVAAAFILLFW
jgi:hypothetical protein